MALRIMGERFRSVDEILFQVFVRHRSLKDGMVTDVVSASACFLRPRILLNLAQSPGYVVEKLAVFAESINFLEEKLRQFLRTGSNSSTTFYPLPRHAMKQKMDGGILRFQSIMLQWVLQVGGVAFADSQERTPFRIIRVSAFDKHDSLSSSRNVPCWYVLPRTSHTFLRAFLRCCILDDLYGKRVQCNLKLQRFLFRHAKTELFYI